MNEQWIIGYDGYCNLCSSTVQWVIRNDPKKRFRYTPLQEGLPRGIGETGGMSGGENRGKVGDKTGGEVGDKTGGEVGDKTGGENGGEAGDTVVLIGEGRMFYRSAAVLLIAIRLRFPWPLLGIFFIIPRFIRDPFYKLVARNRKRWFGERTSCYIP